MNLLTHTLHEPEETSEKPLPLGVGRRMQHGAEGWPFVPIGDQKPNRVCVGQRSLELDMPLGVSGVPESPMTSCFSW